MISSSDYRAGYAAGYKAGLRRTPAPCVNQQQAAEVEWYKQHGKYPERIKLDRDGSPYVIGDKNWRGPPELIDTRVPQLPIHQDHRPNLISLNDLP